MASDPSVKVKISAKADEFSAAVAKVRKELADLGKLGAQTDRMLGGQKPSDPLAAYKKRFGSFYEQAEKRINGGLGFAGRLPGMVPGMGLLAGAGSVAGVGEMMSRFASGGIELQNTARLAGTSAAGLNSLRGAARLMGLQAQDADQAISGLHHTVADAAYGRDDRAARYFAHFGIAITDAAHRARRGEDVLGDVVDLLTRLNKVDPQAAERQANIFGISSSALPMLIRGREALSQYRQEVEHIYGSLDQYQQSSERFTFAQGRMSLASEKLGMTIMTSLEPHLTPLLLNLSKWTEAHQSDIGHVFDGIGRAIQGVNWDEAGRRADGFLTTLGHLGEGAVDLDRRIGHTIENLRELIRLVQWPGLQFRRMLDGGVGSTDEQAQRYGQSYQRLNPPGADSRSLWQRMMPSWLGGANAPGQKAAETALTPEARGLLDTIAGTESRGYNQLYGGGRFGDYSQHPNQAIPITSGPNAGQSSTAAGRYMFLRGTWEEARQALGLPDFSPRSQDRAGWWLAQRDYRARTGRDLSEDLRSNDPRVRANVGRTLSGTWTSLSGGIESTTSDGRFGRELDANISRERGPSDGQAASPTRLAAGQSATNAVAGTVRIQIDHTNAPPGVTVTPTSTGPGAVIEGVRVRRAMPEAGAGGQQRAG